MAKLKFYLNVEGEKLRTLDDLRKNFSAVSVLTHYQSGKLAQWLDVWDYKNELEQVRAIKATDTQDILSELGRIFGVELDMNNIEQKIDAAKSQAQKKNAKDIYERGLIITMLKTIRMQQNVSAKPQKWDMPKLNLFGEQLFWESFR